MRGDATQQLEMLSPVTPDTLVPKAHPIREIRALVDRALGELSPVFDAMYAAAGRPSIPPEQLLKAMLLQAFYTIRSERQLCERLQYDLLFKWFLGLNIADPVFDHSTFSKNRERLLEHDVAGRFFEAIRSEARRRHLLSSEHFTVDGTLLEAWASLKSVQPRDSGGGPPSGKNPDVDFHGQQRRNETHASTTDPEARLARKGNGKETKLAYAGHVLMENRHGLIVEIMLNQADGHAERNAALDMLDRQERPRRVTLGADKGYDTADFTAACRERGVTPHVTQHTTNRKSRIDDRVTRHSGYAVSQRIRKRVEEIFGWIKTIGGGRKLRYIGLERNRLWATLTGAAFNIIRMARIEQQTA
ncbi:MAG: IS5 family transposase [Chloroflexi bacterium]|nr:IS5 family transposase [Chloroflexota bacterium]